MIIWMMVEIITAILKAVVTKDIKQTMIGEAKEILDRVAVDLIAIATITIIMNRQVVIKMPIPI